MSKIKIRSAHVDDCYDLATVVIAANESAFRGRVPDTCLELTPEVSAKNWAENFDSEGKFSQGEYFLVATYQEQIIAYIMSATLSTEQQAELPILEAYNRELQTMSVAPHWQKKGVGRLLVRNLASLLNEEGETHLLVRCLKDNPNCVFYERLGAVRLGELSYDWEGYQTTENLYGWSNISALIDGA